MRAEQLPGRFDLSLPANQRKLEAAEALAQLAEEAGISLIHMALAFVLNHPAVTAAIIGPRTEEHLSHPPARHEPLPANSPASRSPRQTRVYADQAAQIPAQAARVRVPRPRRGGS